MPNRYSVTEPHPTVSSTYMHSGRGGAGNTCKATKTTSGATARGPASLFESGLPHSNGKFSVGRGGAGNILPGSEKAIFSFDEELERQTTRQRRIEERAIMHVGRGGAGNFTTRTPSTSSRKDSASSNGSERSGFFGRLSNTFERR